MVTVSLPMPATSHSSLSPATVAAGEVDADRVAVDAVIGLGDRDVAAAALERDHQLDLVVHVLGQRRIGHGAAVGHDGVGRLGEIERRQPLVLAHLADVLDIVAADAPDAANREFLGGTGDGDGCLRGRRNDVVVGHDEWAVGYGFAGELTRAETPGVSMAVGY